jgi:hypothetical protein
MSAERRGRPDSRAGARRGLEENSEFEQLIDALQLDNRELKVTQFAYVCGCGCGWVGGSVGELL